jgi:hypothetical protein
LAWRATVGQPACGEADSLTERRQGWDIDASIARARELGGSAEDKQPIQGGGWFARCGDTEGNNFWLFQSDESVPAPTEG